jgi:hypothetical protein
MSPSSLTATQSDALGHDTPVSALPASGVDAEDHLDALAPVLTKASPRPSTATHGPPGAHETAFKDWPGSIAAVLHDGEAAVGSDVLSASPLWSAATHSDSEAQETPLGVPAESNALATDHVRGGAACAAEGARTAPSRSASTTATTRCSSPRIGGV